MFLGGNTVMGKLNNEPVEVSLDNYGGLRTFIWRNNVYLVTNCTVKNDQVTCETKQGYVFKLEKQEHWVIIEYGLKTE